MGHQPWVSANKKKKKQPWVSNLTATIQNSEINIKKAKITIFNQKRRSKSNKKEYKYK